MREAEEKRGGDLVGKGLYEKSITSASKHRKKCTKNNKGRKDRRLVKVGFLLKKRKNLRESDLEGESFKLQKQDIEAVSGIASTFSCLTGIIRKKPLGG